MNLRHARRWVSNRPEPARALPKFWNRARKFAWISGVLGLALILSDGNGMWDDTPFQSPVSLVFAGIGLALALSLELARWNMAGTRIYWSRNAAESNAPAKLARWAPWLLWGIVLVGAGALVSGVVEGAIGFDQLVRVILTLFALFGALFTSWRAARDHFGWLLARRTLGALVLMWSVAALFFAIALMPPRAQLNRNLDR